VSVAIWKIQFLDLRTLPVPREALDQFEKIRAPQHVEISARQELFARMWSGCGMRVAMIIWLMIWIRSGL
jgi:hypothetical protein